MQKMSSPIVVIVTAAALLAGSSTASAQSIDAGRGALPLTDTAFEEPGRYTVRIYCEGRVVASKPLFLQQAGSVQDPQRAH